MMDVEPQIAESFARLYPVPVVTADWDNVLDRASWDNILDRAGVRPKHRIRLFAPMTFRRRFALAGGLAGAIGAAWLASTMLSGSPGVIERAQAALDPNGRILHIVSTWVDDRTTLSESWSLSDGSLDHVVYRYPSEAFGADCVISETQTRCWNPALNVIDVYQHWPPEPIAKVFDDLPQFRLDRPETLSRALGSGYARFLGETTIDGTAVYAVLLAVPQVAADGTVSRPTFEEASDTLYIDRETYLPVAERMPTEASMRYFKTFEFLPNTAENREALELPASVDAKVIIHPVGEYPLEDKRPPGGAGGSQSRPSKRGS